MQPAPAIRERAAFWALLALTVATRLAVGLAHHQSLIGNDVYQDDAFYYLRIASNVVHGRGLTFDGAAPTNGFHPLYLLMLLPLVAISRGDLILPIHLSAVLLTAWAAGTAVVLHGMLARLASRGVALFAMLIWAICPYFTIMGVNGLETGVAALFVLLVPSLYLRWFHSDRPPDARRALGFGAVCGLALLARIDLGLLLAAIALVALLRGRRAGQLFRPLGLAVVGMAVVWVPWLAVSHAATGHGLPLSGAASRQIALAFGWLNLRPIWSGVGPDQMLFDPAHVPAAYRLDVATKLAAVFLFELPLLAPARANVAAAPWAELDDYLPYRFLLSNPPLAVLIGLLIAVPVIVIARRRILASSSAETGRPELRTARRLVAVYLLLTAVGYTFVAPVHWYFNRYLVPPILLTTVWLLAELGRFRLAGRARVVAVAVAAAIVATQVAESRFFARLRWGDAPPGGFLASWNALGAGTDPHARMGAFQAGIYGYFSGRDIINLDGKVNQDAFVAIRERRLHEYVRAQGIRYILDVEWMLQTFWLRYAPPGSVSVRAVGTSSGSRVQLFEVTYPTPGDPAR